MSSKKKQDVRSQIEAKSETVTDPGGREVEILSDSEAEKIAAENKLGLRAVHVEALLAGIYPKRYLRNRDAISLEEQRKLADSRVAVIGAGGLGGQVILILARVGIGGLTVIDCDRFDETNLNRQALSQMECLNKSKAEEALNAVSAINPAVEIEAFDLRLTPENVHDLLKDVDIVVDALDNVRDRFLLQSAAEKRGIPLVHGALAGFEGQLMTIFPGDSGLQKIYGTAGIKPGEDPPKGAEAILGVPGVTPSAVATLQAMEVLKILLNRGRIFRNKMVHIDLENGQIDTFLFDQSEE